MTIVSFREYIWKEISETLGRISVVRWSLSLRSDRLLSFFNRSHHFRSKKISMNRIYIIIRGSSILLFTLSIVSLISFRWMISIEISPIRLAAIIIEFILISVVIMMEINRIVITIWRSYESRRAKFTNEKWEKKKSRNFFYIFNWSIRLLLEMR